MVERSKNSKRVVGLFSLYLMFPTLTFSNCHCGEYCGAKCQFSSNERCCCTNNCVAPASAPCSAGCCSNDQGTPCQCQRSDQPTRIAVSTEKWKPLDSATITVRLPFVADKGAVAMRRLADVRLPISHQRRLAWLQVWII